MKRLALLAAIIIVALAAAPKAQGTFRAGVDVVSLNITVMDAMNHYVTDLDEKDFSVFEDGVKQDLSFFTRKQQPIAMSLLLDSSASMEDKMQTLQTAATNFVHRLKSNDLAQVIDFDSRVSIKQAFTSSQGDLQSAEERLPGWMARLITRRLPFTEAHRALVRDPADIKTVLDFG